MAYKMAKNELEKRSYTCDVRAEENGHTINGKPVVYGTYTDIGGVFREIIEFGALDKTDLKDVRFLINHDLNNIPLARSRNNNANSTMRLQIVQDGLEIAADLDTENNADSRKLYSAVQRGDVTGMSFMFSIRGQKWEGLDTDYPTRIITDIGSIVEVSAVTFPAYESTEISARDASALESARSELESARAAEQATLDSVTRKRDFYKKIATL